MDRIIDGFRYVGQVIPDSWEVRKFTVGGHTEISARQRVTWTESPDLVPACRDGDGYKGAPTLEQLAKWEKQDAADVAERKAKALEQSAKRAKTMCRRVIKAEAFNELLTLTYRENQTDRELCKKHFTIWFKRMKRTLGEFRFCASFELQKRGAMHVHVATHKLPKSALYKGVKIKSWELGTRIWRDIVGHEIAGPMPFGVTRPKSENGLCFVGGKSKFGAPNKQKPLSCGRMANYVSKYILKGFEDAPEEKNRYSRSNGTDVPKSTLVQIDNCTLAELIGLVFECGEGDVVIAHSIGRGDSYWLVTEPGGG